MNPNQNLVDEQVLANHAAVMRSLEKTKEIAKVALLTVATASICVGIYTTIKGLNDGSQASASTVL